MVIENILNILYLDEMQDTLVYDDLYQEVFSACHQKYQNTLLL